jgi:hypothetical protein
VLAGLLPYSQPKLPADLNAGFETSYTKKDDSVSSPVDTIIQAGKAAAVDWSKVGLCTYRNNLNKILLTPLALDKEWAVDVCLWGDTLFFDINKAGRQEYDNQEKMTYYGEACTILLRPSELLLCGSLLCSTLSCHVLTMCSSGVTHTIRYGDWTHM